MRQKGFTIVEALLAVLLVGIAIAALLGANTSLSLANDAGIDISTAEFLCEEIKEMMAPLAVVDPDTETTTWGPETGETLSTYDDVDDFDGLTFSPPINSCREVISELSGYRQQITVENMSVANLQQVVSDHSSNFVRITVKILTDSGDVSSVKWIRARY